MTSLPRAWRTDIEDADSGSGRFSDSPPAWPTNPFRWATLALSGTALRGMCGAANLIDRIVPGAVDARGTEERMTTWLTRANWPRRSLRVALCGSGRWTREIEARSGCNAVEWIWSDNTDATEVVRGMNLDAAIAVTDSGVTIVTAEHEGRDAAWADWSATRPLSYPALFPMRLDVSSLSLGIDALGDMGLLRMLAETAAALSRSNSRLSFTDRVNGRLPMDDAELFMTMDALATALGNSSADHGAGSAHRAAARVLGAWAATCPESMLDDERRSEVAEIAAAVCRDEAESALRLAAVRFSCCNDDGGYEAIRSAVSMIPGGDEASIDHVTFVQSELEHGRPDSLTTGRLAAGIVLFGSPLTRDRLEHFRADLCDDMRFAAALVGRDQDHRLLLDIFRFMANTKQSTKRGVRAGRKPRTKPATTKKRAASKPNQTAAKHTSPKRKAA